MVAVRPLPHATGRRDDHIKSAPEGIRSIIICIEGKRKNRKKKSKLSLPGQTVEKTSASGYQVKTKPHAAIAL